MRSDKTEAEFEVDGEVVRIIRAKAGKRDGRGARLVAHLRGSGRCRLERRAIPDFFICAQAAVAGYRLMTRDEARYRTYFPKLPLIIVPGTRTASARCAR
jgi:predicted nucleic acid-binding protein